MSDGTYTSANVAPANSPLAAWGGFRCNDKDTKTERPRDLKVPASALAALDAHRKRQDEFRARFGPDYWANLDLIFANPDGTPLRPNSVSSTVSLLFRRLV